MLAATLWVVKTTTLSTVDYNCLGLIKEYRLSTTLDINDDAITIRVVMIYLFCGLENGN